MCDYDDKTRLQRIASNIASSYTYKEEKNEETGFNTVKFTVTLTNMHDDVVIIDEETNEHYYNNADREIADKWLKRIIKKYKKNNYPKKYKDIEIEGEEEEEEDNKINK